MSSTELEVGSAPVDQGVNSSATSPAAETAGVEKSMLDVVKEATAVSTEASPTSGTVGSDEPKTEPTEDEAPSGEVTDEELRQYPRSSQARIRQLARQRREAEAAVEQYRGKAETLDKVIGRMAELQVDASELDNALAIISLTKRDPSKALETLAPIVRDLAQRAGKTLPQDLMEDVRLGYISEARARELSETRARSALLEQQSQQEREAFERRQQEQELRQRVDTNTRTADQWVRSKATSDPDWAAKETLVAEQVELIIRRNGQYPRTPKETVDVAEEAYAEVNRKLKNLLPRPVARQPVTGESAAPRSAPEPRSLIEAMKLAVGG